MKKLILSFFILICSTSCINSQWYQQTVPPDIGIILSINFMDVNNGSASGWQLYALPEGRAIYTTNGGLNWIVSQVPDSCHAMVSAQFINLTTGYSAAAYNPISKKNNKDIANYFANVKMRMSVSMKDHLTRIGCFEYDSTFGLFLKSTNRGQSWFTYGALPHNVTYLEGIYFINQSTGFVTEQKNLSYDFPGILKTTNGGFSWTEQPVPDSLSELNKIYFIDPNTGFVIGIRNHHAVILRTTNSGSNWGVLNYAWMDHFSDINFTNNSTGFASGVLISPISGVVFKTTNGGINWMMISSMGDSVLLDGIKFFRGSGIGVAYGITLDTESFSSYITRTSNYGLSWNVQSVVIPQNEIINSYMIDNNNWYLCGIDGAFFTFTGLIYHTTTGGDPIGIKSISSEIPKSFTLSQNYPNPFNPSTKIKFEIPASPNPSEGGELSVQLFVYDILGRKVESLIPPLWGGQEGLKPGTYEVEWDASNHPSGVYFYKLQSNEFSETRRMVLIK